MDRLGERIKRLRTEAGLTQEELGTLLGIQKASVQKYEKGVVVNIKPETVERMAHIFGVNPSHIMGWDRFDERALADDVRLIEELIKRFGVVGAECFNILAQINEDGRRKVMFYAEDIKDKYKGE